MPLTDQTREEMRELMTKYPDPRSALLPMLHLVLASEGAVTPSGIEACAEALDMTPAEVSAVATFYTMFKRQPVGKHHLGVCVNPGCAILGGDKLWDVVSDELGVSHDETTEDGIFTVERIECQAACTHAPVMTVDWEFMDDMTPESARELIGKLRAGEEVKSTRGPVITDYAESERAIAGIDDGKGSVPATDAKMLAGLTEAKQRGMAAPAFPATPPPPPAAGQKG